MRNEQGGSPANRARFRRCDPAVIAETLETLTPYCDVICVHLNDIADNNTRAALSAIEQVRQLDLLTAELSEDMRQLAAMISWQRAQIVAVHADQDPEQLRASLLELVDLVAQRAVAAIDRVEQGAGRLSFRSTAIVAEMQFEDIGRQMIGHVTKAIDDLRGQLIRLSGHVGGELGGEAMLASLVSVEDLRHRHVMDVQRMAHSAAAGQTAAGTDLPSIELF